jgi:RNA polymerase sigma factor (sigma-70 family)
MQESDQELLQRCRQGNPQAWDKLLRKYERLVFSIPLNYGLAYDDAADIVQITFTILLQSLDSLQVDTYLGPWLVTVARRHTWRAMEHGRRQAVSKQDDLSQTLASLPDQNNLEAVERQELFEWIHEGLSHLDDRCARLLLALYFEEEPASYGEVGARLGIPVGSIGPTRARCLERLKTILGRSQ